jgi:hypothetical protein
MFPCLPPAPTPPTLIATTVPNLDCIQLMAAKHGSAGHVPSVDIHLHVSDWNEGGSSMLRPKHGCRDPTNGMPGFVRQPDGRQPCQTMCKSMYTTQTALCQKFQLTPPPGPCLTYVHPNIYSAHTHAQSWTQPCPVAVFSDEEYSGVWAVHNAIGLIGLLLNLFLVSTWSLIRYPLLFRMILS